MAYRVETRRRVEAGEGGRDAATPAALLSVEPDDDLSEGAALQVIESGGHVLERVASIDHRLQRHDVHGSDEVFEGTPMTDADA